MNKIFLSVLAITTVTLSFAQDNAKKFYFGLKATPGVYWFKANTSNNQADGPKLGFSYGAMLEFGITENYAFATGLDITTLGGKYTNSDTSTIASFKTTIVAQNDIRLQYIQIPLTLKMKTKDINGIKYFGQFGLGTGVLIKAQNNSITKTTQGTISTELTKNNDDIKTNINPIRLALIIGAGLEYNLAGSTALVAGIGFDNGFLNINRNKNTQILSKGLVLNIGVLF